MTKTELIDKMRKQASCVYLACEKSIADDISYSLWLAAAMLEGNEELVKKIVEKHNDKNN